jgi:hypothetical protein
LAVRHPEYGHWCGYVGVHQGHELHGKRYQDIEDIDVHGGLTYSNKCDPSEREGTGVCHVPGPGEDEDVWWFGFDCAHYNDLSPGLEHLLAQTTEMARARYEKLMAEVPSEHQLSTFMKIHEERRTYPVPPEMAKYYKPIEYVQIECVRLARQLMIAHIEGE